MEEVAKTGMFRLLIRLYKEGAMSQLLKAACPGDNAVLSSAKPTLLPSSWPKFVHVGQMSTLWSSIAGGAIRLGLICAGTGITPCVQTLSYICKAIEFDDRHQRQQERCVGLLTSNRLDAGVLMSAELQAFQRPPTVVIRHTVTELEGSAKRHRSEERSHFTGRVSADMLASTLPTPADGVPCLAVITGPSGFAEHCMPLLLGLGYKQDYITILDA